MFHCAYVLVKVCYLLPLFLYVLPCPPLHLVFPAHIRTPAPRHTSPCARTLVCWSLFSPSCCWLVSQSWALQRTCATCGRRCRRNSVRQRPRSISSSKSLSVSSWAGLCRPTGGSTWSQASGRLLMIWRWRCGNVHMNVTFFFNVVIVYSFFYVSLYSCIVSHPSPHQRLCIGIICLKLCHLGNIQSTKTTDVWRLEVLVWKELLRWALWVHEWQIIFIYRSIQSC